MPQITEHHRRLYALAGAFHGEEIVAASAWAAGGPATAEVTSQVDLGGFFVVHDYVQTQGGQPAIAVHALFTFDDATNEVVLFWFDSYGFVPPAPARGSFDGDVLTLVRSSPRGKAKYTYRFVDDATYTLELASQAPDRDDWFPVMSGTYRRK